MAEQTIGYRYYMGAHMAICHGPIDEMRTILVDGKVAWAGRDTGSQITIDAEGLFGGPSREGGVSGQVDLEFGAPTQLQNTYLQSKLDTDVPAFRGVVGAVLRQVYVGLNPYLKPWSFRAQRIHTRQNGDDQWYDNRAEIDTGVATTTLTGVELEALQNGIVIDFGDIWDFAQVPLVVPPTPATFPVPPFSGVPRKGSFGNLLGLGTTWAANTAMWVQKNFVLTNDLILGVLAPVGTLLITGDIENAALFYVDGVLVHQVNPTNTDTFEVQQGYSFAWVGTPGPHTLSVYCMDESGSPGTDVTYFSCLVQGPALPTQRDMNPAHIVRECLTDRNWGLGYADGDIDDTAFTAAADALFAEGLGMSMVWDKQVTLEKFIQEILRHIDAALYVDRATGKFVLKLIRADYIEAGLPVFDPSNVVRVEKPTRPGFGELLNSVTVSFWDSSSRTDGSVTVANTALVQQQGTLLGTTIQYQGITYRDLASRLALRDLAILSSPLLSCTVYANRTAETLNIGDCFKLTWPDFLIASMVMRVTAIAFGDGANKQVRISAIQDRFSTPTVGVVTDPGTEWIAPGGPPQAASDRLAMELPYLELVQAQGQAATDSALATEPALGYVVAAAAAPDTNSINATLSTDSGAGYVDRGALDFCPTALLVGAVTETTTAWTVDTGASLDQVTLGTYFQVDDELCVVTALNVSLGTMTVGRGVLDTSPRAHVDNSRLFFWDQYNQRDTTQYVDGESIDVKIRPTTGQGTLSLAFAPADTVVLDSRAVRPYPPGRYRIDGSDYPSSVTGLEATASWAHRDRTQQTGGTIVPHTDGSIGPEAGTTYTARLLDEDDNILSTATAISGTSTVVDLTPLPSNVARVQVASVRSAFESFQQARSEFLWPYVPSFVALPLTYDEQDWADEMTWTRQGDGSPITPSGFLGDGYQARLKSTTIPSWMSAAGARTEVQASITPAQEHPRATSDTLVYLGPDVAGVAPDAKIALRTVADPNDSAKRYLALQTYTASTQTLPLARPEWRFQFRFPVLAKNSQTVRPRAIVFLDADNLLVIGNFGGTETVAYKVLVRDGSVVGSFNFGTYLDITAASLAPTGKVWAIAATAKFAVEIDLAASLTAGALVATKTVNLANFTAPTTLGFITITAVDYALLGEYGTGGTPWMYVYPLSLWTNGSTPTLAGRLKRVTVGLDNVGMTNNGTLYVARNSTSGTISQYLTLSTKIGAAADGGTLTSDATLPGCAHQIRDLTYESATSRVWAVSAGFDSEIDFDGWLSFWASPLTGTPVASVENTVNVRHDAGTFTVRMNGHAFDSKAWTPTSAVAAVCIGGPPSQAASVLGGYGSGLVRNVRFQSDVISEADIDVTREGSAYEPNRLNSYSLALTNGDFEAGTAAGWTNETGTLAASNAAGQYGASTYFATGSAEAQTIARQRVDVLAATGLAGADIDGNVAWAALRWKSSSLAGQPTADDDAGTMGIRSLDSVPTQITLSTPSLQSAPFCNGGSSLYFWYNRAHFLDSVSGMRFLDAYFRSDRTTGSGNDYRADNVTLDLVMATAPGEPRGVDAYVPHGADGTLLFGSWRSAGVSKAWSSSDNGVTIGSHANAIGFEPLRIVFGLGVYVAQGGPLGNWVGVTSTISGAWTSKRLANFPLSAVTGGARFDSLVFDGAKFVMAGSDGVIVTRTNVADWTEVTGHQLGDCNIRLLAWDGTYYFAVASDIATGLVGFYRSTNLTAWTNLRDLSAYRILGLSVVNSKVVVVGSQLSVGLTRPFLSHSSNQGTSWTDATVTIGAANAFAVQLKGCAFFSTKYAAFGDNVEAYSSDLNTWTVFEPTTIQQLVSPAQDGTALMAVRFDGTSSVSATLRRSTNGTSWSTVVP